jgi:hypothetical protein
MLVSSKKLLLSCLALFVLVVGIFSQALALEDQFNITLEVTGVADTTSPSIPTGLAATAISSSQIDLSWTASTDNVAVTAYRVYRDNAFIATSTVISYSDTGLSASTAYAYNVSAVDAAYNDSGRSATSTATTSAASVSGGGAGGGAGQYSSPVIYDLSVFPAYENAIISWKTTTPSDFTLQWGTALSYGDGIISDNSFLSTRQAVIPGLIPGTTYFFQLVVHGPSGREVTYQGSFLTFGVEEGLPNISGLQAETVGDSILLTWQNPQFSDFAGVRVVKSPFFFPTDPNDGEVLFEGDAEQFFDEDVSVNKDYFYTVFVKDSFGRFSSGVVVRGKILPPGAPVETNEDILEQLPKAPIIHPKIQVLTFSDFDFIQDGKKLAKFPGDVVAVNGEENLTVSLEYEKVPEILKTIVVTLVDPDDLKKMFSFLLRVNEDKTGYVATIGPLIRSGNYEVRISIVDYKNQGLKKITGTLSATIISAYQSSSYFTNLIGFLVRNFFLLILVILLLIAVAIFLISRRKRKKVNLAY